MSKVRPYVYTASIGAESSSMLFACGARAGVEILIDLRDAPDPAAAEWRPELLRRAAAVRGMAYLRIPAPWRCPLEGLSEMRKRIAGASVCLLHEKREELESVKASIAPCGGLDARGLYAEPAAVLELSFWRSLRGSKSKVDSKSGAGRGTWMPRSRGKKKTWADVARELEGG